MIIHGNSLEVLKSHEDNSIHSVVTDPPYGLKFMGKKWDYDVPSVELWKEVLRVLKPGGHLLSFGGTRTYHRMVVAIEDAGFEIRDQIQWLYGSGFPKSYNVSKGIDKKLGQPQGTTYEPNFKNNDYGRGLGGGKTDTTTKPNTDEAKQWNGFGTALKPANEPICLARKPLSEKTVAANVTKWGVGGINVDGCRVGLNGEKPPTGSGKINDDTKNTYGDKWVGTGGNVTSTQGRWPANIVLDEKAAKALDKQTQEKKPTSRFFYVAKASKRERNEGLDQNELNQNFHPTVKPITLMRYLCRLITPPNGTVLDPFMGSGTTGVAALKEGFGFLGIELSEEYFAIAFRKIEYQSSQKDFLRCLK